MAVVRPSKPASVSDVRGTRSIRTVSRPASPAASANRLPFRPAPTTARSNRSPCMGHRWLRFLSPARGERSVSARDARGPEDLERLADGEDGPGVAVHGVAAVGDIEVGVDISDGEIDAIDRGGEADLPVPVVVVADAVVREALDILVADRAIDLEGEVFIEGVRDWHGDLAPLVPGDAGVGEEVGAVAHGALDLGDAEVVAEDQAALVEVVEQVGGCTEIVVADVAQVAGQLVVESLQPEACDEIDLGDGGIGVAEIDVAAPGADIGAERHVLADRGRLVGEGGLERDLALGLRDAAIGIIGGKGEGRGEGAAERGLPRLLPGRLCWGGLSLALHLPLTGI